VESGTFEVFENQSILRTKFELSEKKLKKFQTFYSDFYFLILWSIFEKSENFLQVKKSLG